jgi:hypothetical protein
MSQTSQTPPPGSNIVLSRHEAGVALDFPLSEDAHLEARRRAWRTFEIAIVLLIICVVIYAACGVMRRAPLFLAGGLAVLFFAGIVLLIIASSRSWHAWSETRGDDFLCQLAVFDDLLVRTWRNQRKDVWYCREISAIWVKDKPSDTAPAGERLPSYLHASAFHLVLELKGGDEITLLADGTNLPAGEFRSQAEMEWIATVLRQACHLGPPDGAIQDLGETARDARPSPDPGLFTTEKTEPD